MVVDCYGHNASSEYFLKKKESACDVVESSGITYMRFYDTTPCAVWKVTTSSGTTTVRWAWGNWANRASLTYDLTPAEPRSVAD